MKKIIMGIFAIVLATQSVNAAITYEQAKLSGKPTVLCISMVGCGACRQFAPTFEEAEKKFSSKFAFAKEDVDSQISKKLNISSVPSVFIMDGKSNKPQEIKWECLQKQQCFEDTLNKY